MLTVRSTINIAGQAVPNIIPAVQGDTGRSIEFTLADFTIPAGSTATYYVQKPSGEAVYNAATINDNKVTVELTAQSLAETGDNYGQVRILNGEDVVTSFDFILLVKPFRGIEAIESTTEMNIFDEAVQNAMANIDGMLPNIIAPVFDTSTTYTAGDYVIYSGKLYQFTAAHTGAWTGADAEETTVSEDITALKEDLVSVQQGDNVFKVDYFAYSNNTAISYDGDGAYNVGTTDYGYSFFGGAVTLSAGVYMLYGVPQGIACLSTSTNKDNIFETNETQAPKRVVIASEKKCYLGFRIQSKPSTAFKITPFLLEMLPLSNKKKIRRISNDLGSYNVVDVFGNETLENGTYSGITFTQNQDGTVTVKGTATSNTYTDYVLPSSNLPSWVSIGKNYYIRYSSENVWFRIYKVKNGSISSVVATKEDSSFAIDDADSIIVRLSVNSGSVVDETVHPIILNAPLTSEEFAKSAYIDISDYAKYSNDANNFSDSGVIFVPHDSATPTNNWANMPANQAFWLVCLNESISTGNLRCQIAYPYNAGQSVWMRVKRFDGWGNWVSMGAVINNTFNTYESTYNISSSPSITTDTNAYLAPTGDNRDVTADIATMLGSYGVCRLGKGDYYVKDLVMPEGAKLVGSGTATKIRMLSGDGCAIQMADYSVIKDIMLIGSTSLVKPSATVRNRHAILWAGTYTEDQNAPYKGIIDGVYIRDFEGGGITCQNTGYGQANSINVSNSYIQRCDAGINISYWSEFNRFTGVKCHGCYYGCVNNGGNNMFMNCDFSANVVGFLMDNENDQSPNNSHGSVIGCIFNHSDDSTGLGVKVLNCPNGYTFTGCQFFFSQIYVERSQGIMFNDCVFGQSNCDITIDDGGLVLFANNNFQGMPKITVTNNNKVHFANCYVRSTGEVVNA
jgi:hypothetical protein